VLKPLSVMIGANGTGKTSVLDVLSLLASSAQGKLNSSPRTGPAFAPKPFRHLFPSARKPLGRPPQFPAISAL
jgi:AAA15 family ATPase/GTPase